MNISIDKLQDYLMPRTGSTDSKRHELSDAYPNLGLRVLLVGSCFLSGAIELFAKAGCTRAETLAEADLVVFLGGEDVDPQLYGEVALRGTYCSPSRDAAEMDVFVEALARSIPMFGICRGFQFLAVMNGNKLYQDVESHGMSHKIIDNNGNVVVASSMHHQMVIENDSTFPLAYALTDDPEIKAWSGIYRTPAKIITDPKHLDLEAAVFPNIGAIGVQGHPEIGGYGPYSAWCLNQVKEFLEERKLMGDNSKPYMTGPAKIDPKVVPPAITNPGVDV